MTRIGRFLDIVRTIFISMESLFVLVCALTFLFCPGACKSITVFISHKGDVLRYSCFLPVVLFVFIVKDWKTLLFPEGEAGKALHSWQDYHMLKDRYLLSVLWTLASSIAGIWAFAISGPDSDYRTGIVILGAIAVSFSSAGSHFLARIMLRQILLETESG